MDGLISAEPTEEELIYLHGPPLTTVHMDSNESLVPVHLNSEMTLTPVHMHYIGDPMLDPIYAPWFTPWHELYPEFCQEWILTSWEDNGDGILSPNDQIDMSDPTGLDVTWYHVDRITWTMLLTNETDPEDQMYVEYKGTFEPIEDPINYPVCTFWHEVYPSYSNVYHIIIATGPLEWCTYIALERFVNGTPTGEISWWHVEEVVRDLILREKIMDPICTWWHEIYPDYCKWWHLTSWEDNQLEGDPGYGQLSPCDQIDMVDPYFPKWETFWSMGDVNRDGLIDILDVELIQEAWGSTPGDPNWNPDADLNQDGIVNMNDMIICVANQGLDIWTYFGVPGPRSKKEWYHVDRVTLTLNVTFGEPLEWMKIELKTYYFEEMYNALKHPIQTRWHEVYPHYSNVYTLTWWDWFLDDNCNGVLDVCDYIWLLNETSGIEERYHVEDICYDLILNKKIANPVCTSWHEVYPDYCQGWHLTSWEDNGDDILSPCDQIDMLTAEDFGKWETFWSMGDTDRDGYIDDDDVDYVEMWFGWHGPPGVHRADLNQDGDVNLTDALRCTLNYGKDIWTYYPELGGKTWYHVDRVTLTLNVTIIGEPDYYYFFEYKGPFEGLYRVKIDPIDTWWTMVWPGYLEENLQIEGWTDNCNGVLDHCDNITLGGALCHVEDLTIDIILNEKITDPVCTWWHELYPKYCNEYHIIGWEDNDDGVLSPCDMVDLDPIGLYHVKGVTLTLFVIPEIQGVPMYIEWEDGFESMYDIKTNPIGPWHEVYPEFCLPYVLVDWLDNCNGVLDYCDWVYLLEPTGYEQWWHVEEVSIDIVVEPPPIHDVAVDSAASLYPWVYPSEIDPITVAVTNYGDFDEPTVDVYAFYDGTLAAPKQTTNLAVGETKTLTFYWNTTGVPIGFYTVRANATIPIDDVPGNNYLVGNVQEVRALPPPPEDLELFPRAVEDLEFPMGTQWHELHPSKTNYYHLSDWLPGMVLGPEDWVMMDGWWFLVDDLTIDIEVVDVETQVRYWLDYECGYWTFNPRNPVSTKWNEIKNSETHTPPEWPRCWHLIDWEDNGDGRLSFCDLIIMAPNDPFPGAPHMFHVELVTVTLKLTDEGMQQHYLEFMGTLEEFEANDFIHFPLVTLWLEIWPEQGRPWMLMDWTDQPLLAPSDRIVLTLKSPNTHEPIPDIWAEYHVDKVTVAMNLTNMDNEMTHIVKFEGSIVQFKYHHWMYDPPYSEGPFGTQWHEVNPTYCRQWCIIDWDDNGNFILDYCDLIWMVDKETGVVVPFHVESLSTDIYVSPLAIHDVAVTNVTVCYGATLIHGGTIACINVTVTNEGDVTETFDTTTYWNTTNEIETIEFTLPSGDSNSTCFSWDTTGLTEYEDYEISAYAHPVPGETDLADNTFTYGIVKIVHVGDVNADEKVRVDDVLAVALRFGTDYGGPPNSNGYFYDPNTDLNCDGKIRVDDVLGTALQFGWTKP